MLPELWWPCDSPKCKTVANLLSSGGVDNFVAARALNFNKTQ